MKPSWIEPDWPAPPSVRALSTLRGGGVSRGVYADFNLGMHVGDSPDDVATNRRRLREVFNLPSEPAWLEQVHGNRVIRADEPAANRQADASYTLETGVVCTVMTADCLPVLFCNRDGDRVAAAHAGWRGLADGVLESTVQALSGPNLMAWMGPAIGPQRFEVGSQVRLAFMERLDDCDAAFRRSGEDRWLADLYLLARRILARAGVEEVYGGHHCTHSESLRFFSYRRDGQTGRMATLIWRE
ncbi:MAG: peptidoglycan editing factor PgeF [Methylococcaceae bacterium]|nr:peptidoglycan editing factor PgeF [Methylococcaceae bacterium]